MAEGWWRLQSGHSGFWLLLLLYCLPLLWHVSSMASVPLGIPAVPWSTSYPSDHCVLLLFPSDSLLLSLFPCSLHVPFSSLWSFLSFLKYVFAEAGLTSLMGSALACNGSRAIWNGLCPAQNRTFFHRGHPCNSPLPKLCHTNTETFIHIVFFRQRVHIPPPLFKNWIESSEILSSACSHQLSSFLSSQPALWLLI